LSLRPTTLFDYVLAEPLHPYRVLTDDQVVHLRPPNIPRRRKHRTRDSLIEAAQEGLAAGAMQIATDSPPARATGASTLFL